MNITTSRSLRWCLHALLLLSTQRAVAQDAAPTETPSETPSETPPTAASEETAPEAAVPSGGDTTIMASPEVLENAKRHFKQGIAFAEAGNCGAAVVEFEAAYNIIPRPNALYNIAQCEERLFRYDLAIKYYERYLQEAPPDAPDRPAVEAALKTLGNLLGVVHVKSNVPAEVWIDDHLGGQAPGEVYVPAGGHTIELRAEGYIPKRTEVRLVGREEVTISITLDKAQTTVNVTETTGISPTLFWIGASATVVTVGVGGFFAMRVSSLHGEAEKIPAVSPERASKKKDIESAELIADVFFATGAVLAIGTTIVGFMTDWDAEDRTSDATPPEGAVSVSPVVAPGFAGLSLRGGL